MLHRRALEAAERKRRRLVRVFVDGEDRERLAVLGQDRRAGQIGGGLAHAAGIGRDLKLGAQRRAAAEARAVVERPVGRLRPRAAIRLGHDRRERVDQLREAGDLDHVGVIEQGVEHAADDERVGKIIPLLLNRAGDRPLRRHHAVLRVVVPDVPLVKREADVLVAAGFEADFFTDVRDLPNKARHFHVSREEIHDVPLRVRIILVQREVVDVGIALAQNLFFPHAEGRHGAERAAADHKLNIRVEHLHQLCRFAGDAAILGRRLRADLPRAVHFIAEAPELDTVRRVVAVFAALVSPVGVRAAVAVFQQLDGILRRAGAEIDGQHWLNAGTLTPAQELVRADLVRLDRAPGHVGPDRAAVFRVDTVFPVIAGDEVAARIADLRDMQGSDECFHVGTEAKAVARHAVAGHELLDDPPLRPHEGRDLQPHSDHAGQAVFHAGAGRPAVRGYKLIRRLFDFGRQTGHNETKRMLPAV